MITKLAHAVAPGLVIASATVLCAVGKIDGTTAVAMISAAGGFGVVAVSKASGQ